MKPQDYQQVMIGLDRALFVFHEAGDRLTDYDRAIVRLISSLRSEVERTGSGHPFPSYSQPRLPEIVNLPPRGREAANTAAHQG